MPRTTLHDSVKHAKPRYYACEICGHAHPWNWNGDCRDNANRFTDDQLDAEHGPTGYELSTMTERLLTDQKGKG